MAKQVKQGSAKVVVAGSELLALASQWLAFRGIADADGKLAAALAERAAKVVPAVRQGERQFPAERRDGAKVGKAYGLLLTAWYNGIGDTLAAGLATCDVVEGSKLPAYDDDAVQVATRHEYPNRNTSTANGGFGQSTAAYRGYYNNREHGCGAAGYVWPKPASVPGKRKGKVASVPSVPAVKPATQAKPASK